MKVLVVDDDLTLRATIVEFLVAKGHDVSVASGARQAVNMLLDINVEHPFEVVITDVQMPAGSGIDLLQGIWRLGEPLPKVLVHSSEENFTSYGDDINLPVFVPEIFGEFAVFRLKSRVAPLA